MAIGREILTKIRSVQSTQKITRAMQMVSTSKMRKTQERMKMARPYAEKIRILMSHIGRANTDLDLPLLASRSSIKNAGILLITTDKGLCGGLNINALKTFYAKTKALQDDGANVEVCCVGAKGLMAAKRVKMNVIASATHLGDVAKMDDLHKKSWTLQRPTRNHQTHKKSKTIESTNKRIKRKLRKTNP
jgi:F-type H+-transporting ATPase subunit gamma